MKKLLLVCCLIIFTATAWAEIIPGRLIVRFKPNVIEVPKGLTVASLKAASVRPASVKALNSKYNVQKLKKIYAEALALKPGRKFLDDYYVVYFPTGESVAAAAADFSSDPNVLMAVPSTRVHIHSTTPNDPRFPDQYALTNIQAPQGWDRTTGDSSVVVAVLDTGISYTHPDLSAARIDPRGKNIINPSATPADDHGHGTEVSGIIGATTNNGIGVAGVDWQCKILPIKVLDSLGSGAIEDILSGLAYASACEADVVNMSFGQYETSAPLQQACQDAHDSGQLLIASAGNGNTSQEAYPAAFDTVVAIAAVDQDDKRSIWSGTDPYTGRRQASNYGPWVGLSAPGTLIWTTTYDGSYSGGINGTSSAAPFVAGLAALVKSVNPSLSNSALAEKISDGADNVDALNPGFAGWLGSGRINAYRTLSGIVASITSPESGAYVAGQVSFLGSASAWDFASYRLEVFSSEALIATIESSAVSVEAGVLGSWGSTQVTDGSYSIKLNVISAGGISEETEIELFVNNNSPEAVITSPASGASLEGEVTISGTAGNAFFDYYQLLFGAGTSPSTFETIGGNVYGRYYTPVSGGTLGSWQTAGLSGTYTLRLVVYNKVGQSTTNELVVFVNNEAPTKEVSTVAALPLVYTLPNPFSRTTDTSLTFNYDLAGNFESRIYLFDLSGNLIWQRRYAAGENGGKSGPNNPAWDAADNFGAAVPNGLYLYQLISDGKVLARGKLIVLN